MSMWPSTVHLIIERGRHLPGAYGRKRNCVLPGAPAAAPARADSVARRSGPLRDNPSLPCGSRYSCAHATLHVACNGLPTPANIARLKRNESGLRGAGFWLLLMRARVTPVEIKVGRNGGSEKTR